MDSRVFRHPAILSLACAAGMWFTSCRSGTVIAPGAENERARGTLAGTVTGPEGSLPVARRLVEAVEVATAARFSTMTDSAGAFSFLLPAGTYRIEVALGRGETVVEQPPPAEVKPGELKTGVDVVFGGAGVVDPSGGY
ncbi:MAG TPA: carboxypeptidase-like regulatory domain-containing protein [Vicinamibacteria bacterium]|nr:carboxypeptidase-like regulatory domain-containing protein [Vicinamibacteria bacterium]